MVLTRAWSVTSEFSRCNLCTCAADGDVKGETVAEGPEDKANDDIGVTLEMGRGGGGEQSRAHCGAD